MKETFGWKFDILFRFVFDVLKTEILLISVPLKASRVRF